MRRKSSFGLWLGLCLLVSACRPNVLDLVGSQIAFSSPDDPAALTKLDAGIFRIDFGQALVGETKILTLDATSIGSPVTLGAVTAVRPDAEFSLPFVPGTVVQVAPSQVTASFTPTSAGEKSAAMQLVIYAPATEAVVFELSGVGVDNGLTVTPNPVDFGRVELNRSQSVILTIANHSAVIESLAIAPLQGENADRFVLGEPSSEALAPGASATLSVNFVPLVDGAASASFTVSPAAAGQPVTVNLTGTGVDNLLQVTSPLEFGFVQVGGSIVKSAAVKNLSSYTTLNLVAPQPEVNQASAAHAFLLAPTAPAVPLAIPPQQSALIPISFAPPALNEFSGTLLLATDDPLVQFPVVDLHGYGGGPLISCLPVLGFGAVAAGDTVFEDSFCLNAGTNIPSLPMLGLAIAQKDLETDTSAFSPHLLQPDGGLAGPSDGVSLLAGQLARIRVAFHPEDAGVFQSRLTVPSNDVNDLDAGTLLLGQGGLSGTCNLQVAPMDLSFGEVPLGARAILQFELSNTSQEVCTPRVGLDPDSDPAFSLPDSGPGVLTLAFPGNPSGQPTSVVLEAEFAPKVAEAVALGKIDVTGVDAGTLAQSISLTGISQASCFTIAPPELNFGVVGFSATSQGICTPVSASFVAVNQCATPVVLNQIAISSGLSLAQQFSLQSNLHVPLTLAAGDQVSFEASFIPTDPGPKVGAITVASSAIPSAPVRITLRGDAELVATRVDSFVVPTLSKKVDLLWLLDEDDDADQVASVAGVLPELIDAMNQDGLDYQIAVTSTDTCDAGSSDQGAFEPCDHCLSASASSPTFFTPASADAATGLSDLFAVFDVAPQLGLCEKVNGDEHFFDSTSEAFSPLMLGGHNAGFVRDGAYLAIVLVNGDAEDDANGAGTGAIYDTSLAQLTTQLRSLKPNPSLLSVSYINSGAGTQGAGQIGQLVASTGGIEIDTAGDLGALASLPSLFARTEGGAFTLSAIPTSIDQIHVDVDGTQSVAWTYDISLNQIVFSPDSMPPQGSVVTVTYEVSCS